VLLASPAVTDTPVGADEVDPMPHETIFPTRETVKSALYVIVKEFPVVLLVNVHVPTMSPAVPLDLVHMSPPSYVMVVDVIVTPVLVLVSPADGPSHVKFELVQFEV